MSINEQKWLDSSSVFRWICFRYKFSHSPSYFNCSRWVLTVPQRGSCSLLQRTLCGLPVSPVTQSPPTELGSHQTTSSWWNKICNDSSLCLCPGWLLFETTFHLVPLTAHRSSFTHSLWEALLHQAGWVLFLWAGAINPFLSHSASQMDGDHWWNHWWSLPSLLHRNLQEAGTGPFQLWILEPSPGPGMRVYYWDF